MAILFINAPSPRHTPTAPVQRASSRVYSPFPTRRLVRPMAIRAEAMAAKPKRHLFSRA